MPSGYVVTWSNNGITNGPTTHYLNCFLFALVIWKASVPLAMGANTISVTATDANGHVGTDTIRVYRAPDTTPPTVQWITPPRNSTGVAVNTDVVVSFSEAMDYTTINSGNITIKNTADQVIPATVTYDSIMNIANVRPNLSLDYSTAYQVTVGTGVKDLLGGNGLAAPYTSTFTTGVSTDTTPPSIQSVSPPDGSYCASTTGTVTAQFSEGLNPSTVNSGTFSLVGLGTQISGTVSYANGTATLIPSSALSTGASYTATLSTGMKDLAGNALAAPFNWTFTTLASQGSGTWSPTNQTGTPFARSGHVAVWTGTEMVVAGGMAWDSDWNRFDYTDQTGRYNPATGTWNLARGAPGAIDQKAVWTGSRMLVWGGYVSGIPVANGAVFNPSTNSWTAISTAGQPSARHNHSAVWTGIEMIVWGGQKLNDSLAGDGARYNPATNSWQPVSTTGAPSARHSHSAVWTGSEMIVWGGAADGPIFNDCASYNPSTDTWTPLSTTGAPTVRYGHVAVWTGSEMIVWSSEFGGTNPGGLYNPITDTWRAMDTMCAPSGRGHTAAIWTDSRMIVWGGSTTNSFFSDGAMYNPAANTWTLLSTTGVPTARAYHTGVWTGDKMIVWGGTDGTVLSSGGHFTP